MTRGGSRRQVLLVKSPTLDVPDYFVLQDIIYGPAASQINLPVFSGKPQPGHGGKANWVHLPPIDSPNYTRGDRSGLPLADGAGDHGRASAEGQRGRRVRLGHRRAPAGRARTGRS